MEGSHSIGSAARDRQQVEVWEADAAAESLRMRKLLELAEVAHQRMAHMSLEEKKQLLELLEVQVIIMSYEQLRLRITGVLSEPDDGNSNWADLRVGRQGLEPCPPD